MNVPIFVWCEVIAVNTRLITVEDARQYGEKELLD